MADRDEDHLTRLAPELQHMIFGYLLPSHEPDKAFELETEKVEKKGCTHSLDYLAATCKALRDEVNEWALHFLAQHKDITKYKPFKTNRIQQRRDFLRGRHGLLTWADKHCVFCGNKSSRSAILMNGLRCCSKCDKEQWPDKITKTEARMKYDLKDEHLLPNTILSPTAARMLKEHPGLPVVRYGTYVTSNVPTTMFLRKDVEELALLLHGDLKAHLAKRQADRDERRRKAREAKARKDAETARLDAEADALVKETMYQDHLEEARRIRKANEELLWSYKHKSKSIAWYGDENGPTVPPMPKSPESSDDGEKKRKEKHRKNLSIDSNAANEGIDLRPPPPPKEKIVRKAPSPVPGYVTPNRDPYSAGLVEELFRLDEEATMAEGVE